MQQQYGQSSQTEFVFRHKAVLSWDFLALGAVVYSRDIAPAERTQPWSLRGGNSSFLLQKYRINSSKR